MVYTSACHLLTLADVSPAIQSGSKARWLVARIRFDVNGNKIWAMIREIVPSLDIQYEYQVMPEAIQLGAEQCRDAPTLAVAAGR